MTPPYARILVAMLGVALKRALQYRVDFVIEGGLALFMVAVQLVPVFVLFSERQALAGWSFAQVLVLLGWYLMTRAILEGVITSSFSQSIGGIRSGRFDYILIKPANSLFLCSVANLRPWKLVDLLAGAAVLGKGLSELGRQPSMGDVALALGLSIAALVTLYSLYVLAVAGSFALVRIQNLISVLNALFDFARWPAQVFGGAWRVLLTLVLPLAVITTHPVMALLHTISPAEVLMSLAVAAVFALAAHLAWTSALGLYKSASS